MLPLNFFITDADMLQIILIHPSLIPTLEAIPRKEEKAKQWPGKVSAVQDGS